MKYSKLIKTAGIALGAVSLAGLVSASALAASKDFIIAGPRTQGGGLECSVDDPRYSIYFESGGGGSSSNYTRQVYVRLRNCQDENAFDYSLTVNGHHYFPMQRYSPNPEWTNADKMIDKGTLREGYTIMVTRDIEKDMLPQVDYQGKLSIEVSVREARMGEDDRFFKASVNCRISKSREYSFLKCSSGKIFPLKEVIPK